jgi:hypothetical protein
MGDKLTPRFPGWSLRLASGKFQSRGGARSDRLDTTFAREVDLLKIKRPSAGFVQVKDLGLHRCAVSTA